MIVFTREDNRAIIQPAGEDVVAASVPELRTTMRTALDQGVRDLVMDLSHVHMVDSSGIGLLISAHNSLTQLGGKLSVVHASRDILDLFHMMRIHQHFSVSGESAEDDDGSRP